MEDLVTAYQIARATSLSFREGSYLSKEKEFTIPPDSRKFFECEIHTPPCLRSWGEIIEITERIEGLLFLVEVESRSPYQLWSMGIKDDNIQGIRNKITRDWRVIPEAIGIRFLKEGK